MAAYLRLILLSILLGLLLPASAAQGQTEIERERASLRGVEGFYLSLNVEGPRSVLEQEALDFDPLKQAVRARLDEAGLPVQPDAELPSEARLPYLHVHLNTMDAGRGLVPFSVEVRFYQGVRLTRDPAATTVAATWGASVVGIASYDRLPIIAESALSLLEDFVRDFRSVNP